jgi:hypothetical protein
MMILGAAARISGHVRWGDSLAAGAWPRNAINSNADAKHPVVTGPAIHAAAVVADLHPLPGPLNGRHQVQVDRPRDAARTMSPTSSFVGSAGATVTSCRLRISGTIDEPLGRSSIVAPAATLPAAESSNPPRVQRGKSPVNSPLNKRHQAAGQKAARTGSQPGRSPCH